MEDKKTPEIALEVNPTLALETAVAEGEKENNKPKPTPEEIEEAEANFNKAIKEWEKITFELSPSPEIGQNFIDYIRTYLETHMMWTQNAWMGAIKLDEELNQSEKDYHASKKKNAPIIGYQALEFIIYILGNPGGIGLATAKAFEATAEEHVVVLEYLERQSESARKSLDDIKFLQEKWAAYEQGFYFDKEPTDEEMPEGSYYDKDADKFLKPGDDGYEIQKFIEAVKDQYGDKAADEVVENMKAIEENDSVGPRLEVTEIKNETKTQ